MIQILILWFLSVLLDDNRHETLATFGYILSGVFAVLWLVAVVQAAAQVEDK